MVTILYDPEVDIVTIRLQPKSNEVGFIDYDLTLVENWMHLSVDKDGNAYDIDIQNASKRVPHLVVMAQDAKELAERLMALDELIELEEDLGLREPN